MKARTPRIAGIEPRMKHGWNTDGIEGYGDSWNSPLRMGIVRRGARKAGGRSTTTPKHEIQPRMEHGWNTEAVTAPPKAFGATGRAKLLLSPIFALPLHSRVPSVFHPWPQILSELLMGFSTS